MWITKHLSCILPVNYPGNSPRTKNSRVWPGERQGIREFLSYPSIYSLLLFSPMYHVVKS